LPLQTVAIIGAGPAGRAFALRCVAAGLDVVLEDVMPSNLRRAQDDYADLARPGSAGSLRYALTVEDAVHSADIAVDFVPDELESKLEIFSLLDRMAPPRTVFLTHLSGLSITDLASCTYRAGLCVGLRGELRGGAVEVVLSRFVESGVIAEVLRFLGRIGVVATVVEDVEESMLVR
jgi:3-hydroxybutyryl-CoA dehydrogenase